MLGGGDELRSTSALRGVGGTGGTGNPGKRNARNRATWKKRAHARIVVYCTLYIITSMCIKSVFHS